MPTVAAILRLGGILLCLLGFSGDAAAALVQILSHRSGDEVPAGEVILLVKVTLDPGQALRELSVRIDGAPEVRLAPRSSRQITVRPDSRYRIEAHGAGDQLIEAFDAESCYTYINDPTPALRRFDRIGPATNRTCGGTGFSGNFMNWARPAATASSTPRP